MTQLPPAGLPEPGHRYAARNLCDGCLWEVTGTPASCQDGCSLRSGHAGLCHPRCETDQPCGRCGAAGSRLTRHEPQGDEEAASCLPSDIPARIAYLDSIAAGCSATGHGDGHCDHPDCPACDLDRARELAELRGLAGAEFEVSYWVPTRYVVRLGAAATAAVLRRQGYREEAAVAMQIARGVITEGDSDSDPRVDGETEEPGLHRLARALHRENNALRIAAPAGEPGDYDTPEDYKVWL